MSKKRIFFKDMVIKHRKVLILFNKFNSGKIKYVLSRANRWKGSEDNISNIISKMKNHSSSGTYNNGLVVQNGWGILSIQTINFRSVKFRKSTRNHHVEDL